ncbi:hypothetical protein CVU37_06460 [candidate division BRC1 bacterium HGW-BRC1-1]|jgi:predicted PurR-regulated permease PerM|nr:MAG: hypothetical protein CVU37_06460 [candidate division BRC1 bacterium HGW-BRC1-1]
MNPEPLSPLMQDRALRRGLTILVYMAIAAGALFFVRALQPAISLVLNVLLPFIVALTIAYIANPLVRLLQWHLRLGRMGAVLITYFIIICVTVAGVAILAPIVYEQFSAGVQGVRSGIQKMPDMIDSAADRMRLRLRSEDLDQLKQLFKGRIDVDDMATKAGPIAQGIYNQAMDWAGIAAKWTVVGISLLIGGIAFITFVLMITFYFLLDYGNINRIVRTILPLHLERKVFSTWHKVDEALGGLLRGQLIVCVLISIMYTIALVLLGMKQYAVLIGLLAGFGNLIPYFGPIVGGVPTAIWVLFSEHYDTGNEKMLAIGAVLLLSVTIQSLDGFFFQPRIVGKSANLHPVAVILALLVGAQFGLGGLILAVPTMVIVRVLVKEFWWDNKVAEEAAEKSRPLSMESTENGSD